MTDSGNGKVCVLNLNPGEVRAEFCEAAVRMVVEDTNSRRIIGQFRTTIAGPLLDIYRNRGVEWFLKESDCEWLLFIDSDIVWTTEDIYTLLDQADPITSPVVSGVYLMILPEGIRPSMFFRDVGEDGQTPFIPWQGELPTSPNLIDVDGTGAGFLLIHRSLLNGMLNVFGAPMPWFANEVEAGVVEGEDFTFCKRVQLMGYRVYAYTGVQLDHIKHTVLSAETYNEQLTRDKAEVNV